MYEEKSHFDPAPQYIPFDNEDQHKQKARMEAMTNDQIIAYAAKLPPWVQFIGSSIIAARATDAQSKQLNEHAAKLSAIDGNVTGIHTIARRPEWKTWTLWIALSSALPAIVTLIIAWPRSSRPADVQKAIQSNPQKSDVPTQGTSGAIQRDTGANTSNLPPPKAQSLSGTQTTPLSTNAQPKQ